MPHIQNNRTPNAEIAAIAKECQSAHSLEPVMKYDLKFYQEKTGIMDKVYVQELILGGLWNDLYGKFGPILMAVSSFYRH